MARILDFLSDSSMQCARLRVLEYLSEDMACCRMKMPAVHRLHAMWVLVKTLNIQARKKW